MGQVLELGPEGDGFARHRLICGAYLHARVVRGWRGKRAALLLMVVFAAVLFTFFGNLFFGGLHAYG